MRDLYRIPTYVKDANNDEKYIAQLSQQMLKKMKVSLLFQNLLLIVNFHFTKCVMNGHWACADPTHNFFF